MTTKTYGCEDDDSKFLISYTNYWNSQFEFNIENDYYGMYLKNNDDLDLWGSSTKQIFMISALTDASVYIQFKATGRYLSCNSNEHPEAVKLVASESGS